VLQVEPPDVGSPQEVLVRFAFCVPPKPQLLRFAALAGELSYLHQDYGAPHDWRPLAPVALCYASGVGVQPRPSPNAHCRFSLAQVQQMSASGSPLAQAFSGPNWQFIELPTGHWPMFSRPDDLAAALLELPLGDCGQDAGERES
jgi:hypothetical protein